jgi:5-(carboxyamino)imidazole ribonucleotide synthase
MTMTVGILGAGQLAQMLCIAARSMRLSTLCLAKNEDDCAGLVSDLLVDAHNDASIWHTFCARVELITLETENIPLDMAEFIQEKKPLLPNLNTLAISQDRGHEKATFRLLEIPAADYRLIDSQRDLSLAISELGLPAVLKTRRFGYDGKGQYVLRSQEDADTAWQALQDQPLILEAFIPFETEVSLVGARSIHGETVFYPLVENTHHQGILHQTIAPYWNDALTESAQNTMLSLMNHLDYHGVMAIEFFVKDGKLIANEMAPRVHNTGHWTIEGASVSQFEQHLRAITGLPLKPVHLKGTSVMINCIGNLPDKQAVAKIPHTFFHTYGKSIAPLRKVGHITVVHPNRTEALKLAEQIKELWG